MTISNNQAISIKWYNGSYESSAIASAIAATANDGSILFMPSGSNGGSLYANGRQFGLDEESIKTLAYEVSTSAITTSNKDIVSLIEAIDAQLSTLSGTIGNIQGQVNGITVTGSTNINVISATGTSGTTFTISATGLATTGDVEVAVSGVNNSLQAEISGVKSSLTGTVSDLTGAIGNVQQYATLVSGSVNNVSGALNNLSGTVSGLADTVNQLTSTSSSTLSALHAIEAELNDPNNDESGTIGTFLDTVYSVANGFLTGGGETGASPISIKDYVDSISGAVSSLSGSVANKVDNDTQTYLTQGNDIAISGSVVAGGTGTYTISLASETKSLINTANTNANSALTGANTAVSALGTLTGAGQVKTYIDEAASNAILKWEVVS